MHVDNVLSLFVVLILVAATPAASENAAQTAAAAAKSEIVKQRQSELLKSVQKEQVHWSCNLLDMY